MTNKKVKYSPKKGRLMEIDGRARRIYWSGDMLSLLRREFPTTINEELAGMLGISARSGGDLANLLITIMVGAPRMRDVFVAALTAYDTPKKQQLIWRRK